MAITVKHKSVLIEVTANEPFTYLHELVNSLSLVVKNQAPEFYNSDSTLKTLAFIENLIPSLAEIKASTTRPAPKCQRLEIPRHGFWFKSRQTNKPTK